MYKKQVEFKIAAQLLLNIFFSLHKINIFRYYFKLEKMSSRVYVVKSFRNNFNDIH